MTQTLPASTTSNTAPSPRPGLEKVRAYTRSPQPPWVDLLLDANEGPPVAEDAVSALASVSPSSVAEYPRVEALEAAIASSIGCGGDQVLATAGGDEAIDRVCRAFLAPGRRLVLAPPTFEMIRHYGLLAGADVVETPWPAGRPPIDAMIATAAPCALIALVSPNNPTGCVATGDELLRLADARPDCLLLFDHAYAEFADKDLTATALTRRNIVTIRTFSKAYSAAGLRLGYAAGDPAVIRAMRAAGGPFNVTAPTIAAGLALVQRGVPRTMIEEVRGERAWLEAFLRKCGFELPESQANFVLARGPRATALMRGLSALGIAVRGYAHSALADAVRITCPGDAARMARLQISLESVLRPRRIVADPGLGRELRALSSLRSVPIEQADPAPAEPGWFLTGDSSQIAAARAARLLPMLLTDTPADAERIGAIPVRSLETLAEFLP